jgi:hypothetical protein
MVAASLTRSDNVYSSSPSTSINGSPSGARPARRTCVPGMQPISSSLRAISGSLRQHTVAVSPTRKSLAVRRSETGAGVATEEERRRKAKMPGLFRQDLNKDTPVWLSKVPHLATMAFRPCPPGTLLAFARHRAVRARQRRAEISSASVKGRGLSKLFYVLLVVLSNAML